VFEKKNVVRRLQGGAEAIRATGHERMSISICHIDMGIDMGYRMSMAYRYGYRYVIRDVDMGHLIIALIRSHVSSD